MDNSTKNAQHHTVIFAGILAVVILLWAILKWQLGADWNGFVVHYCSYMLQYCGLDMRITLKETFFDWVAYAFLPTIALLIFIFYHAKAKFMHKKLSEVSYALLFLVLSFPLQGLLALYLPIDISIEYSASRYPMHYFINHQIISVSTVGVIFALLIFASVLSLKYTKSKD